GAAILGQDGVTYPLLSVEEAHRHLAGKGWSRDEFRKLVKFDPALVKHWAYLMRGVPEAEMFDCLSRLAGDRSVALAIAREVTGAAFKAFGDGPPFGGSHEWLWNAALAREVLARDGDPSPKPAAKLEAARMAAAVELAFARQDELPAERAEAIRGKLLRFFAL